MEAAIQESNEERLRRHRQTEAVRRKRMKAAIEGLREVLHLDHTTERASIMEKSLDMLKEYVDIKKQIATGQLVLVAPQEHCSRPVDSQTSLSMDFVSTYTEQSTAFETSNLPASTCYSSSASLSEDIDTEINLSSAAPADSLFSSNPTMDQLINFDPSDFMDHHSDQLAVQMLDLPPQLPTANELMKPRVTSLDSPMLRRSVGLFIMDRQSYGLDSNQNALDFLGLQSSEAINQPWSQSKFLIDKPLVQTAMNQLFGGLCTTVKLLEKIRRIDGTVSWAQTIITRIEDQCDLSDPAAAAVGYEPTFFGICQPAQAPMDGRGRVWTDDHLIHISSNVFDDC
eukprot:TRINITY_DN7116_c0_g1_i1.p1 TRINITY_DN7116_c0_g1~~TRINITY_DN7116_c0_g1_i1.p1  ORF type:complete len:341 (+),score=53.17 TRINITY_DN7116_c0_g1_i1:195-1217(+)